MSYPELAQAKLRNVFHSAKVFHREKSDCVNIVKSGLE